MKLRTQQLLEVLLKSVIVFLLLGIFRNRSTFISAFHLTNSFFQNPNLSYYWDSIFMLLFLGYVMYWAVFFHSIVQHKNMRRYLFWMMLLMIFWVIVRIVKYHIAEGIVIRYFWYLYYFPMLFVPMLGVFCVLYLGHDENYKIPGRYIFIVITAILFLLVMTNELHQLVFKFDPVQFGIDGMYTYGIIYYFVAFWMVFLIFLMIVIIYRKCRVMASRKKIWVPLLCLLIPFIWAFMKLVLWVEMFDVTTVYIWSYLVLWQSLIYSGFIPSNIEYDTIFDNANVSAQILDRNNDTIYSTKNSITLSKYLIEKSKLSSTQLDERTLIKTRPIIGGSIVWLEDISSMNIMISKLKKLQMQLEDNNELLQAEIELKEKQERIQTQNMVYDQISSELYSSIDTLNSLLNESNPDLVRICFVGAYIKRMSNLIILQQNNKWIQSKELDYCFKESIDVLKTRGILCSFDNHVDGDIDTKIVKEAYTDFVKTIQIVYDSLSSIMVHFQKKDGYILKISMDGNFKSLLENQIDADVIEEEGTTFLTYKLKEEKL